MPRRRQIRWEWETLPDIDKTARFFTRAGLEVERKPGGLFVGGSRFPLDDIPRRAVTVYWPARIDAFVAEQLPERLEQQAGNSGVLERGYSAERSPDGLRINRDGVVVGSIRATGATVVGEATIPGNFLLPGDHWAQLARLLGAHAERARRPPIERDRHRAGFFAELERLVDAVYHGDARIPDLRAEYPWVTGYLGDPFAPVWFVAEAPSLRRVETAGLGQQTPEMQ